ncbi:cohesin domain-containing protein [Paenibacillus alkalitolerans]|uniref:cohesin domain-containing protein n=1 Tax=Paenibacillus alkalitolerans TaxID=2799335 RepID=UPI0018F3A098|nr:cohesin domain-containing protein [Paenibacillus alkalitolerans]
MGRRRRTLSSILSVALLLSLFSGFASAASGASWAELSVDLADRSLGEIYHGASAALYGLSEPNVPDINTLIPLKPSHISQKAPDGVQHPSGDGLRVADYFFEAGGGFVQVLIQDYYGLWYYPSRTAEEYINEAVVPVATAVKAYKDEWAAKHPGQDPDEKFLYIPYNEPEQNGTRYPSINNANATGENSRNTFNNDWLKVYRAIKAIDPGAKISGPNLINYKSNVMNSFISFCVRNDCLPDIVSWHLLSNKAYNHAASNLAAYRALEATLVSEYESLYPDRKSPFPIPVDINEYASTAEIASGGSLVQYIARYDELKIHGALPYWNTANSYGSLLAGQNEPNGAWWLYKWYADMQGDMAKVSVVKANDDSDAYGQGLYGFSTIDDDKKQVNIAFGGTKGESRIVFRNITGQENSPSFLAGADQVHITVWYAGYTGLTGFLVEPAQIIDGNFDVVDGSVTLPVRMDDHTAVYFAVMTEAADSEPSEVWTERYEAEEAEVRVNVQSPQNVYPRTNSGRSSSNGQHIGGIDYPDSMIKFTSVTVPKDGSYRLDIVEGSGSTAQLPAQSGGGVSNQRQNSEFFIKIDDQPSFKVVLRADYSWQQMGMVSKYIDLTAGTHSIAIGKYNQDTGEMGQGAATLDAVELTYNGVMGSQPSYRVQAEFADYDVSKGLTRESVLPGFEGAGYVTGYHAADAKTRFVLSVLEDGMYDVTFKLATDSAGKLIVDHDRRNVMNIPLNNTNGTWREWTVKMFLRTGINLIDVKSASDIKLDYIEAVYAGKDPIITIEAEDAVVAGTPAEGDPPLIRGDAFAKYASGGKYVNGITSYDGQERYLEIPDIYVPQSGTYKLVITYANGEYSGSHSYNNNVVERYAQMSVNGAEPQTVYFKNTISWQQFATVTLDVELREGTNSIRFSNNNTYDGGSNPYGGSNASGTEPFVPTVMVPKQYTPAFDKFDIYPLPVIADRNSEPSAAHPVISLEGADRVKVNESFELTLRMTGLPKNSKEARMTLSYDPDIIEFIAAEPIMKGLDVLAAPSETAGEIVVTMKKTPEIGSGDLLKLHWRAKQSEAVSADIKVKDAGIVKAQAVPLYDMIYTVAIYADVRSIEVKGAGGADSITSNKGTLQMEAKVAPANANQTVTWSVYDLEDNETDIAVIGPDGVLTAAGNGKNGQVKVTAEATDGTGVMGETIVHIGNQLLQVTGTPFGLGPAWSPGGEYDKAFDGDVNTFYDYYTANGGYTGIDLGEGNSAVINQIRFYPRIGFAGRMPGGKFQGSNEGPDTGFVDLYTIPFTPPAGWNEVTISDPTAYRYLRYVAPDGGYGNIAEVEFFTNP